MSAVKRARPEAVKGTTQKITTAMGKLYVTISVDDEGEPIEMFVTIGKAGAPIVADAEAIGRLVSLALRHGISLDEIHKQLRGISSDRPHNGGEGNVVLSMPDAVGLAISRWKEGRK